MIENRLNIYCKNCGSSMSIKEDVIVCKVCSEDILEIEINYKKYPIKNIILFNKIKKDLFFIGHPNQSLILDSDTMKINKKKLLIGYILFIDGKMQLEIDTALKGRFKNENLITSVWELENINKYDINTTVFPLFSNFFIYRKKYFICDLHSSFGKLSLKDKNTKIKKYYSSYFIATTDGKILYPSKKKRTHNNKISYSKKNKNIYESTPEFETLSFPFEPKSKFDFFKTSKLVKLLILILFIVLVITIISIKENTKVNSTKLNKTQQNPTKTQQRLNKDSTKLNKKIIQKTLFSDEFQKFTIGVKKKYTYKEAVTYCKNLDFEKWELPSSEQMRNLMTQKSSYGGVNLPKEMAKIDYKSHENSWYWSSTSIDKNHAYMINYYRGIGLLKRNKNNKYMVKCIKNN